MSNLSKNAKTGAEDANAISGYIINMSTKARILARILAFALIVMTLVFSYTNGSFKPTGNIFYSFICGIVYLLLDLAYYVLMTYLYKRILTSYFEPIEGDGFVYKDGYNERRLSAYTRKLMNFGYWYLIIISILLIISLAVFISHFV